MGEKRMIVIIDNYDSFVYNLARYAGKLGKIRKVYRNNDPALANLNPDDIDSFIISPGPCTPEQSGYSKQIIEKYGSKIPILGVCLGHQCIGEVYGGITVRSLKPVHGKTSEIKHNGQGLFLGLPNPLRGARYHSLSVYLPEESALQVTAQSVSGEIMAFEHRYHPVYGIQFHPESILTDEGLDIIRNFFILADQWKNKSQAA